MPAFCPSVIYLQGFQASHQQSAVTPAGVICVPKDKAACVCEREIRLADGGPGRLALSHMHTAQRWTLHRYTMRRPRSSAGGVATRHSRAPIDLRHAPQNGLQPHTQAGTPGTRPTQRAVSPGVQRQRPDSRRNRQPRLLPCREPANGTARLGSALPKAGPRGLLMTRPLSSKGAMHR